VDLDPIVGREVKDNVTLVRKAPDPVTHIAPVSSVKRMVGEKCKLLSEYGDKLICLVFGISRYEVPDIV
jgi:hypothetical protein